MGLPHGWRFERGGKKPCPHCNGTGERDGTDEMIAPSGHREDVFGFTPKHAAEYAEIWAPERCSPEKRQQLYGS